jgi:hypothetical protein
VHKYGKVKLINEGFLNRKNCENVATNSNSEKARSRIEASSAGMRWYGDKGRWVNYWARLGFFISPCYNPFSFGARFETDEPFIFSIFFFGPR